MVKPDSGGKKRKKNRPSAEREPAVEGSPKASAQPVEAEGRLRLEDVAWAGGSAEDLELLQDVEDDDDGDALELDGGPSDLAELQRAVAAKVADLGLAKPPASSERQTAKAQERKEAQAAVKEFLAQEQHGGGETELPGPSSGALGKRGAEIANSLFRGHYPLGVEWWKQEEPVPISKGKKAKPEAVDRAAVDKLRERATKLLGGISAEYQRLIGSKGSQDQRYLRSVVRTGTLSDKVAGLTLLVEENFLAQTDSLRQLTAMAVKKNQREAMLAMEALKDLYSSQLLPARPLRFMWENPAVTGGLSGPLDDQVLLQALLEEIVKGCYAELTMALDRGTHNTVEHFRSSCTRLVQIMLAEKPENERQLLRTLCNKLGDSSKKLASRTLQLLQKLVDIHPNMKGVVTREIEDMLHRPHLSARAQYYAVLFLNQIMLQRGQEAFAQRLIAIYFETFGRLVSRTDADARILGALLTGVNRAYPYAKMQFEVFEQHAEALFKMIHISSFAVAIQALMLLLQVMASQGVLSDRFFRALYALLQSSRLHKSSKQPLFLNLLFKALKLDTNLDRIKAFTKRLLQACAFAAPTFICGSLYLVSELMKLHPGLSSILGPSGDSDYDPIKRDPQHCGASASTLWELASLGSHFHPSVAHFAQSITQGESIEFDGDPLVHFSLVAFLDRFVYKNPRAVAREKSSGLRSNMRPNKQLATVNSAGFLAQSSKDVAPNEVFFYKYFTERHKRKPKPMKKDTTEDEDMDHIADEEAEAFLRSLGDGEEDGEDDEMPDFADDAYEEGFEPDEDDFDYEGGETLDFDDAAADEEAQEEEKPKKKPKLPKYADADDYVSMM